MKDLKKLVFKPSDVRDFRIICDQIDRLQKKCKDILWALMAKNLRPSVTENLDSLEFNELTNSKIDRSTKAGVLCDDMQRFLRFKTAAKIMTKSTDADKEVETLSDDLESSLFSFTSLMGKVLRQNSIPSPPPEDLNGLEDQLDEKTKVFLESFDEAAPVENTDGSEIDESKVDEVRNFVILRTLSETILFFKIDFGHLIAG
ncbi:uncharacterized protein [Montipora capricornis]|uniref:uncharacterized protein n=1 Tax=Montipora foliosa TaxID=591990 RepID=UPI0035F19D0D